MTNFNNIKVWLGNNYNIKVSDAWLDACLEWILVESEGQNLPVEQLQSQVFDQWLMSDLSEIAEPVLPAEITTEKKLDLISNYPLQIISCVDAGFPLYGQKQKLLGRENPNEHVTADTSKPFQAAWEPKSSQMLVLEMTDGHTNVRGLEVERISGLHAELPSGYKVLVCGTVVSRRGMLMLTPSHIQLLGGEVDALSEVNTPLANLERAMEKNREDGGHAKQEFSGKFLIRGDKKKMMQQNSSSRWNKPGSCSSSSSFQNFSKPNSIKPEIKPNDTNYSKFGTFVKQEVKSQQSQRQSNFQTSNNLKKEEIKFEEFDEDMTEIAELLDDDMDMMDDDDLLLASTMISDSPQPSSNIKSSDKLTSSMNTKSSVIVSPLSESCNKNPYSLQNNKTDKLSERFVKVPQLGDDYADDMFDDDFDALLEAEVSMTKEEKGRDDKVSTTNNLIGSNSSLPWLKNQDQGSNRKMEKSLSIKSNSNSPVTVPSISQNVSQISDSKCNSPQVKSKPLTFTSSNLHQGSNKRSNSVKLESQKQQTFPLSKTATSTASHMKPTSNAPRLSQSKLSDMFKPKSSNPMKEKVSKLSESRTCSPETSLNLSGESSPLRRSRLFESKNCSTPKAVVQPFQADLSRFAQLWDREPFCYLCELGNYPGSSVIVKAYISTLTGRLNTCGGEKWSLTCRINDGTKCVEVEIHDNILSTMIGFSAEESSILKQQMNTDPEILKIFKEGLSGCQDQLATTSCLMELKVPTRDSQSKPELVNLIEITADHVMKLRQRVR